MAANKQLGSVLAFVTGAIRCWVMADVARRRALASEYAPPQLLAAMLILVFVPLGSQRAACEGLLLPFTVLALCFILGLNHAVMSRLSHGVTRSTHLTGGARARRGGFCARRVGAGPGAEPPALPLAAMPASEWR